MQNVKVSKGSKLSGFCVKLQYSGEVYEAAAAAVALIYYL